MVRKLWYDLKNKIFLKELMIIEKEIIDPRLYYSKTGNLCVEGIIKIKDIEQPFRLLYPHTYPYSPPKIWPFKDKSFTETVDFSETTHQNRDESICLFTGDGGPGDWKFTMNISNIIEKFKISLIKAKERTHTNNHTSLFTVLPGRRKQTEFYIPSENLQYINSIDDKVGELLLYSFKDERPAKIISLCKSNDEIKKLSNSKFWNDFNLKPDPALGIFIRLDFEIERFREILGENESLYDFLQILGFNYSLIGDSEFLLFIFSDTERIKEKIINPIDFNPHVSYAYQIKNVDLTNINRLPLFNVYAVKIPEDCFQRTYGVLENVIDEINGKKVMLIGLGTLGSFIAIELLKSGIKNFVLYDFDTLQPVNICRHIGNLDDIGRFKSDIIEERMKKRNPAIEVEVNNVNPFKDKNIGEFLKILKETDLVIITTGDHNSQFLLNIFSIENKVPVIYGWCGPNASQGRIFRVFPLKTPCYHCINLQLENETEQFPRIKKLIRRGEWPQFEGYRQPGVPGISIDINFVGLFISRFALQTLLRNNPDYSDSFANHYIWQNQPSDLSGNELTLIAFDEFIRIRDCPFCSLRSRMPILDRKTKMKIHKLEKKLLKK